MPIAKVLSRTLAGLALVFLVLTLTYSPPSYACLPAVFPMVFIISDVLLPSKSETSEKKGETIISKIVLGLLIVGVLGCLASVLVLWKMGPFGKSLNLK